MKLSDKVAVITGGGSGIGAALAVRFAREGAAGVVVSDVNRAAAEAIASSIAAAAGASSTVAVADSTDVADAAAVDALVERTLERFGRIDLFVSNAGITTGAGIDDVAAWQRAFEINLLAHLPLVTMMLAGGVALASALALGVRRRCLRRVRRGDDTH